MLRVMVGTFREGGRTPVIATHSLESGLEMGARVVILAKGKVACEESTRGLTLETLEAAYYELTGAGS